MTATIPDPLAPPEVDSRKRKPISKRVRFEVFKRDGFVCQYCGATPPKVILHIDHIHPVVDGGSNHIDNLITACEPCNLGKGAVQLSDVPKSLKDKAGEIAEREDQIKGYNDVLMARARRLENDCWHVVQRLEFDVPQESYSRRRLQSIRRFLEILPLSEVLDAAMIVSSKWSVMSERAFKYFCGVCWKKIREDGL
jgi:hypothetical protein